MVPASPAGLATFSHGEIVKFFSAGVLIFQLPSLWGTLPKIHLKNPSDSYAVLLGQDAAHTPCSPPANPGGAHGARRCTCAVGGTLGPRGSGDRRLRGLCRVGTCRSLQGGHGGGRGLTSHGDE